MMLFMPMAVLTADGGWLLVPAMLVAGCVFPVVHLVVMTGGPRQAPALLGAGILCLGLLSFAMFPPEQSLFMAAASVSLTTLFAAGWYRRERRRSPVESTV